jgi:ubiquinone/menaquinone biosynthesis C-methylase UbiE
MDQEEIWDKIASKWNRFRTKSHEDVEKFLDKQKGKVLDLGCGSGRNFRKLDKVELTGVDFSQELLKYAKENAEKKNVTVDLIEAEAFNLPLDDSSFDAVLFYAVLHCIDTAEKRKKSLEEIHRILKPKGKVLLSTWGRGSSRIKNKEKQDSVKWTLDSGEIVNRYVYIFEFEELVKLCESIGFKVLKSWENKNINLILKK